MDAVRLVSALRDPASVAGMDGAGWTGLIAAARAEQLIGSLAFRLEGQPMPEAAARILDDARMATAEWRRAALWEAEMARRALAPLGVPVVLLKGTAYHAAGLDASIGRAVGDLDILVPRDALHQVEAALLGAGWEWVKPDPYDDAYYRSWMHELPPLIHRARDRMIDVHHTILPLTAKLRPNAEALLATSVATTRSGPMRVLAPADMVVHAAAHLIADGDLAGGLRNLWDTDRLCRQFAAENPEFWTALQARATLHELSEPLACAVRLAHRLYETPVPPIYRSATRFDRLIERRLLARDDWGRATRKLTRFGFYARSHLLRMPPAMLARHLWTKWRKA